MWYITIKEGKNFSHSNDPAVAGKHIQLGSRVARQKGVSPMGSIEVDSLPSDMDVLCKASILMF